jgi:1,4-alpha-glucan branching enzyme
MFSFRHSKPSRVEIVGSFNNWEPVPLVKGENHTWSVSLSLTPGEYTYNFVADGKVIRDPNNPRTAPEGRSLLVVKPLE